MRLRYDTLDVFTQTRFGGNQLAVVHDADALSHDRMQAIAREFDYSETVFLLKPETPDGTARMRIFTPGMELPFAGHPIVGTAVLLAIAGQGTGADGDGTEAVRLEVPVGTVTVHVAAGGDECRVARFAAPRLPVPAEPPPDPGALADALGIGVETIGFGAHVPRAFEAGVAFNYVPVASCEVLSRCRVVQPAWNTAFSGGTSANAFVYCRGEEGDEVAFHARMFAPAMGVDEDPATGAAAVAFAGQIAASQELADGAHGIEIEQGRDMGRPSRLHLDMDMAGSALAAAHLGGGAIRVCEGTMTV
ncbi:PhzF family phenazine biosynthesis protein [Kaustia mangrovi]|uniref:PhzF family phenazine biosynthesis protein n=1 Tax=Kaustia mangrovi TaxID=2593653 RepID=A0A7S8C2C2_9HYPH|nr:PhzF family phenazine biosynthesis protein [Kaustia mangrovi]QPC42056.1 PhzF family phenazine biosynthesis protein [Kaustia mangrovi]